MIDAASSGASQAMKLVGSVIVNIIAFLSLLAFINDTLTWFGKRAGVNDPPLTFEVRAAGVNDPPLTFEVRTAGVNDPPLASEVACVKDP